MKAQARPAIIETLDGHRYAGMMSEREHAGKTWLQLETFVSHPHYKEGVLAHVLFDSDEICTVAITDQETISRFTTNNPFKVATLEELHIEGMPDAPQPPRKRKTATTSGDRLRDLERSVSATLEQAMKDAGMAGSVRIVHVKCSDPSCDLCNPTDGGKAADQPESDVARSNRQFAEDVASSLGFGPKPASETDKLNAQFLADVDKQVEKMDKPKPHDATCDCPDCARKVFESITTDKPF